MAKLSTLAVLSLGLLLSLVSAERPSQLAREEGALYVEDVLDKPIKLKVLKAGNAYSTLQGQRYLGTIRPGQEATLLAISDRAYRVRARAQQGPIAGWVGPGFFEKLAPEFVENLKKAAERKALVEELIANEEVALGMSSAEVVASLGEPTKRASKVTADGREMTLEYIEYDRVPQTSYIRNALGQIVRRTTYVKVESGRTTVMLKDDVVASIEESENNEARRRRGIIVPMPIDLFF